MHFINLLLAPIFGVIILTVTRIVEQPELGNVAAIVTAVIGVIGFIGTFVRGRLNHKKVEEVEQAASYVAGFDSLIKHLQEEIDEISTTQEEERKKWTTEKAHLLATIGTLRSELQESIAANHVTKGELAELRGQIKGFLNAKEYAEFEKHLFRRDP